MINHVLLPNIPLQKGFVYPAYERFLADWREQAIQSADSGIIAASVCHQATLIDLVLHGKLRHDWLGVMDEYLLNDNKPIAYSELYGKQLHKFDNQYLQTTIHAIYTRWWIEQLEGKKNKDYFADLILQKQQDNGLFYDRDVSETILRHRMKLEITMAMAMAVEILQTADRIDNKKAIAYSTDIVCPTKCPALGYISMEYFRLKALQMLGYKSLFPVGIEIHLESCAETLAVGWCDFAMKSKVDAYMGTAKRTKRDKPIHSPLIACHVIALLDSITDETIKANITIKVKEYACYLKKNPLDIPGFQMRDVPIRFGADKTPIEMICASYLISNL